MPLKDPIMGNQKGDLLLVPLDDGFLDQQTKQVLEALQAEEARSRSSFDNLNFFERAMSYDRQRRYFERMLHSKSDKLFIIRSDPDNRMVGTIGLHEIDLNVRNARIGALIFSADDRGKGIGSRSIGMILKYGFETLGLNKVYLNVFAENEKGRRLYSKLGFVEEGTLVQEYFLRGQYHDMVRMRMLRSEWEKLS